MKTTKISVDELKTWLNDRMTRYAKNVDLLVGIKNTYNLTELDENSLISIEQNKYIELLQVLTYLENLENLENKETTK